MTSRWAPNQDDEQFEAERIRRKEEKQKLKVERQRKAEAEEERKKQEASLEESAPPTKRPKLTTESGDVEGMNLLEFPTPSFGPSRDLELYEILNRIEEGSYGFVSRAKVRSSGEVVALKRLKVDQNNEGFPVTGLREIQTLSACSHPNIVNLREVIVGGGPPQDVYLVMDFLEHDLKDLLGEMDDPFSPSEIKTLMLQICSGVDYLHSNWIIHRDLKTSNLLLNNRGEIKLADFGMARYTGNPPPKLTQLVVTLWYRAPELLLGAEQYGFEIDVWSVGCIFIELLTREPAFQGRNEVAQLSEIFSLLGTPTTKSWPGFKSLPNAKALYSLLSTANRSRSKLSAGRFPYLTKAGLELLADMLSLNPENRPTASEILSDQYFKEDPRPKAKGMFPTFPSKAGQERRRRKETPQAPDRGEAPRLRADEFATIFTNRDEETPGAGFSLRVE